MTKKHQFQPKGNAAMSAPILPVILDLDGELRTTSAAIAVGVGLSHASTIKLVRRYQAEISRFGPLRFEIQKGCALPQGGFAKATEYAFLNEGQATFLISLMRNTAAVVEFKIRLVEEFIRMKAALQSRHASLWRQLQAVIAQEVESKVKASFGSHLMLRRRAEKSLLEGERLSLESQIQPGLWLQ